MFNLESFLTHYSLSITHYDVYQIADHIHLVLMLST